MTVAKKYDNCTNKYDGIQKYYDKSLSLGNVYVDFEIITTTLKKYYLKIGISCS